MGIRGQLSEAGSGGRGRISGVWEALWASFGFLSGVAMFAGVALGLGLPALDDALNIDLPVLSFDDQSSARSLLETIGTTTVAVAGLSFSVTVVAFTLASSQLSPRVLRSFRSDRLSQATLAVFLGTFIYCLTLLVRLGTSGQDAEPPNLSVSIAVLLALLAFALFAAFIAHILTMLQPSSVIEEIRGDATRLIGQRYPSGSHAPSEPERAAERARDRCAAGRPRELEADGGGYLTLVQIGPIVEAAESSGALVRQRTEVGSFLLPGETIAEIWADGADEGLDRAVRSSFTLGKQRTMVQDVAFPVRQLADIALKGLSPGINDPTTAENAIEALTATLVEFARSERPDPIRVGADEEPRLLTVAPGLDDLVRLGFDQVRVFAAPYPVVSGKLLEMLDALESAAQGDGPAQAEIDRQRRLLAAGIGAEGPTESEQAEIRRRASASP